jgi:corrinoid protein of di/trimethylamine methyltransferase
MDEHELHEVQYRAIVDGDRKGAEQAAREAVAQHIDLMACVEHGFARGIREVGRLFGTGDYFLPELIQGAEAMSVAMVILRPHFGNGGAAAETRSCVVLGTVSGDIHDIGKTLVRSLLEAHGYRVVDLGQSVPDQRFADAVRQEQASILGLSALLTTTMPGQRRVIRLLEQQGLRDQVAVLVGGAPVTREFAADIGADGYAPNAVLALEEVHRLIERRG